MPNFDPIVPNIRMISQKITIFLTASAYFICGFSMVKPLISQRFATTGNTEAESRHERPAFQCCVPPLGFAGREWAGAWGQWIEEKVCTNLALQKSFRPSIFCYRLKTNKVTMGLCETLVYIPKYPKSDCLSSFSHLD